MHLVADDDEEKEVEEENLWAAVGTAAASGSASPPGPSLPWRAAALKRNALESKLEVAWGGGIGNADYFATTLVICTCSALFPFFYIFSFQQILWKSM